MYFEPLKGYYITQIIYFN